MKTVLVVFAVLALMVCSGFAMADELPAIPVDPAQTKVLILPVLDETGDRPDMQKEHVNFGNHRLEYEFITRGFQVMGPEMAIHAARNEDFDLGDQDSRTKANMKKLAADTGADWVVGGAVIEVKETKSHFNQRRAQAKVQMRILDVKQNGWICDRYFEDHKDNWQEGSGTTGLFRAAIDTTLQRLTSNLLDQYPQFVHVYGEFDENDYLAGQTVAFAGSRDKPFGGLQENQPPSDPSSPPGAKQ